MEAYGEAKCRLFARMRRGQLAAIAAHHPLLERLRAACGGIGDHAYVGALPGVTVETATTAAGDAAADVPATCTARVQLPGDDTVIEVRRGASTHGAVCTLKPLPRVGVFSPSLAKRRAIERLGCSTRAVRSLLVSSSPHGSQHPPLSYGSPPSISSNLV